MNIRKHAVLAMAVTGCLAADSGVFGEEASGPEPQIHKSPAEAAEHSLKVGAKLPEFSLPDEDGKPVDSKTLLEKGPLVLVFYRGGWCPFCNLALRGLAEAMPRIQKAGGFLVELSPELPEKAAETKGKESLEYKVLSDKGSQVARLFGLAYRMPDEVVQKGKYDEWLHWFNGDNSLVLPVPATYVISKDGIIRYAFANPDYTKRADPDDIVNSLSRLR